MKTVCEINKCNDCGACASICPKNAIQIVDSMACCNAEIDTDICVKCGKCYDVCPRNSPLEFHSSMFKMQGWAKEERIRREGSSGGAATAIAKHFIKSGGVVYCCAFIEGSFSFNRVTQIDWLKKSSGSKYVKSVAYNVFQAIEADLKNGRDVLFIGLPCQVAGIKKFVKSAEKLTTVDLICHGTPSPLLLEAFFKEHGIIMQECSNVSFRAKGKFRVNVQGAKKQVVSQNVMDCYSIAFLNGVSYTENCYSCPYARTQRISDVTLGDSWGSQLSKEEIKKGISLILCQTEKGIDLIKASDINLEDVDFGRALQFNQQLRTASQLSKKREIFFKKVSLIGFDKTVKLIFPFQYLKQQIKKNKLVIKILHR